MKILNTETWHIFVRHGNGWKYYIFNGQYKCRLKKIILKVLYFTFIKKEYQIQIKQRQAPSHQSYSTERKLKPENSK